MKEFCKAIGLLVFYLFIFSCLIGCSSKEDTIVVSNNQFIQTNYDYNCLDGTKTFTQIILCYQAQDSSEKAQNNLTNSLIADTKH